MSKKRLGGLLGICIVLMLAVLPYVSCCTSEEEDVVVTVNMGSTSQPTTNNPFAMGIGAGDGTHQNFMYEPLVRSMFSEAPEPGLAETWTYNDTTKIWTLNLFENAKFNDGTKVTAADAKFSLDKSMDLVMGQVSELSAYIKQVDSSTPAAAGLTIEIVHSDTAADSIVRNTGSFITDGFIANGFMKLAGTIDGPDKGTTGDQDGMYKVKTATATTLTLYEHHTLVAEPAIENKISLSGGPDPDAITAVDAETLTIEIESFRAQLIRYLGNTAIVPKAEWEDMTDTEIKAYANNSPIGSGPFVLRERELDSHTIYDVNPNYWGGEPSVDVLKNLWFADDEAELLALRSGQIDFSSHFGMPSAVPQLTADADIRIFPITANTTISFYGNWRHEPWNLQPFRAAVSMAINRQSIVNFAANGWGSVPPMVERDPVFSDMVGLEDDWEWPGLAEETQADRIVAANAMLDAIPNMTTIAGGTAGVRKYNGTLLEFNIEAATSFANQLAAAGQVVADLANIGINMNLVPETSTALVGRVYRQKSDASLADWETHVWGRAFTSDFDYLAGQYQKYLSTDSKRLTARSYLCGLSGATYETLGADLITIQGLPEDNATRIALVEKSIKTMAEELYAIPLYTSIAPAVYRTDRFTGWEEGNGYLFYGAVQELSDARNVMKLVLKPGASAS